MTGRVLPFDSSAHAAADALLPWYVNQTLKGDELAFVKQHVRTCHQCQREVDWLREVFAACAAIPMAQDAAATAADPVASIEPPRRQQARRTGISLGWRNAQPWMRWLVAAQVAAIGVLGTLLAMETPTDGTYRTLGAPNRSALTRDAIAVMFDPAITEAEMRRIVAGVGARIVDGPTSTNGFVLEIPAQRSDQAMKMLRAERAVRLAERLGARSGP